MPKRVCILGGGSFGTVIARIVASNLTKTEASEEHIFHPTLNLWVRRQSLADQINSTHENSEYVPGSPIPSNVVANSEIGTVLDGADVIIVAIPHTYITKDILKAINERCNQSADVVHVVSLVKGVYYDEDSKVLTRVTEFLHQSLNGETSNSNSNGNSNGRKFAISLVMGANVSHQMGRDEFAESTLACPTPDDAPMLHAIFHDPDRFHISLTPDVAGVEFCGILKNVVALGVGYALGSDLGSNTQAAIIRRGLKEIIKFSKTYGGDRVRDETFFESAGIADLMTTCFCGRGRMLAKAFVKHDGKVGWRELEKEILGGQQIPDWHNAQMVYKFLKGRG